MEESRLIEDLFAEARTEAEPKILRQSVPDKINITESKTEGDFIFAVLYNAELFDHQRFGKWIFYQSPPVQRAAKLCPPHALYRLVADDRPCAVSGYKRLGPNEAAVAIVSFGEPHVSFVDPSHIKNVTSEEKAHLAKNQSSDVQREGTTGNLHEAESYTTRSDDVGASKGK